MRFGPDGLRGAVTWVTWRNRPGPGQVLVLNLPELEDGGRRAGVAGAPAAQPSRIPGRSSLCATEGTWLPRSFQI